MAVIAPRNWNDFQHYKLRSPPWVKLHKKLLDNFDYQRLPLASKALAPMLWLLASEHEEGEIDADPEKLAFRLRMDVSDINVGLKPLIDKEFFFVVHGDISLLASCMQHALPETEKRQRTETEKEAEPRKRVTTPEKPESVQQETWDDWVALRKGKGAKVSGTVVREASKEAEKAGLTLERFLQIWCLRGSQGLQADWLKPEERGKGLNGHFNKQEALEASNRAVADRVIAKIWSQE